MPKKKAKGKAKKTSKEATKKTETEAAAHHQAEQTTATTNQEESLEAQTQRLKIGNKTQDDDDDAFLEDAMKLAAAEKKKLDSEKEKAAKLITTGKCNHGCDPLPEESLDCVGFMKTIFDILFKAGETHPMDIILNAAMAAYGKYPELWEDPTKMGWVLSALLAHGTKHIINGDNIHKNSARLTSSIVIFFEQFAAVKVHKTQSSPNFCQLAEMLDIDEHTLVRFFRKRIPCKCLDEKYKEVKHITKMGMCFNAQCTVPGKMVERKGMLHCIRCRQVYYCSRECQVAHWSTHKQYCDECFDRQAEFEAEQTAAE